MKGKKKQKNICRMHEDEGRRENQVIRQGDEVFDGEPLQAVAEESHGGGDEDDDGERETREGEAGGPTEDLAHVVGGCEVVEFDLRDVEKGFEGRGIVGEVEVCAGEGLNPDGRHQNHPLPRLSGHRRHNVRLCLCLRSIAPLQRNRSATQITINTQTKSLFQLPVNTYTKHRQLVN